MNNIVYNTPAFGYPGGKSKSVPHILPHLPKGKGWGEVFCGSAVITMSREISPFEIINDRDGEIANFYKMLQQHGDEMISRLEYVVHSRGLWEEWKKNPSDEPLLRAIQWYYVHCYSFGQLGRNFGRDSKPTPNTMSGKIRNKLPLLEKINDRLSRVLIEKLDWEEIVNTYDSPEMVWYFDPPYLNVHLSTYKYEMTKEDHIDMCDRIMRMKGFVALSGYDNDVYSKYKWDKKHTWETSVQIQPAAYTEGNGRAGWEGTMKGRGEAATECLWIKWNQFREWKTQ